MSDCRDLCVLCQTLAKVFGDYVVESGIINDSLTINLAARLSALTAFQNDLVHASQNMCWMFLVVRVYEKSRRNILNYVAISAQHHNTFTKQCTMIFKEFLLLPLGMMYPFNGERIGKYMPSFISLTLGSA